MLHPHLEQHGVELPGVMTTMKPRDGSTAPAWQGITVYSRIDPMQPEAPCMVCVQVYDHGASTSVRLTADNAVQLARNLLAAVSMVERLGGAAVTLQTPASELQEVL